MGPTERVEHAEVKMLGKRALNTAKLPSFWNGTLSSNELKISIHYHHFILITEGEQICNKSIHKMSVSFTACLNIGRGEKMIQIPDQGQVSSIQY